MKKQSLIARASFLPTQPVNFALYIMKKYLNDIDRPDLAKLSWQKLHGFFRQYPNIIKVIDYVQNCGLDEVLHARTSLQMLNIRPKHRYDSNVHVLRFTEVENKVQIDMFGPQSDLIKSFLVESDLVIEKADELLSFLVKEYNLSI